MASFVPLFRFAAFTVTIFLRASSNNNPGLLTLFSFLLSPPPFFSLFSPSSFFLLPPFSKQLLDSDGARVGSIAGPSPEELVGMAAQVKEVVPQASDAVSRPIFVCLLL